MQLAPGSGQSKHRAFDAHFSVYRMHHKPEFARPQIYICTTCTWTLSVACLTIPCHDPQCLPRIQAHTGTNLFVAITH